MDGLYQRGNTCASVICPSDNPWRGGPEWWRPKGWIAGANIKEQVFSKNIWVEDSYYYDPCTNPNEFQLQWEYAEGMFTRFDVTELEEFTPRTPPQTEFSWEKTCIDAWKPTTDCSEFEIEQIGRGHIEVTSVYDPTKLLYEQPMGSCWVTQDVDENSETEEQGNDTEEDGISDDESDENEDEGESDSEEDNNISDNDE